MYDHIKYIVDESTGCWNCTSHKPDIGKRGYFSCRLDGYHYLHRYMYAQQYGNIASEDIIRHICDNSLCINPEHLLKGTHSDNVQDRVSRNRSAKGINHGRSKLTEYQVLEIYNSTMKQCELARKYDVDPKVIYDIKHNNINIRTLHLMVIPHHRQYHMACLHILLLFKFLHIYCSIIP